MTSIEHDAPFLPPVSSAPRFASSLSIEKLTSFNHESGEPSLEGYRAWCGAFCEPSPLNDADEVTPLRAGKAKAAAPKT